ncbi:alpha/beta hydrolase [Dethiobacter alkaliphilus]|uniref:Alpha/beta hydrolase fold-5 domain-containing protein n=1 Tax=Dethiobacter alkaliphilus AHT 1 TaxID=555088 RepID=C0GFI3_DETAL|nr:alpha/beta hydrolase [Dethiobacter alkaliphilus]EEG77943.1 conserved hypothetical protein [Dethiobacter alkaliphilus AHT 1]
MKKFKILKLTAGVIFLVLAGALSFLYFTHYRATTEVLALIDAHYLAEETDKALEFWPPHQESEIGLIIYPGGNVDFRAYSRLALEISKHGYYTVIARMPLSLAVLDQRHADGIIDSNSHIQKWVIAGHSLGGAMAARYARENNTLLDGLILWASYPDVDLSASGIKVMSIYATNDGIINQRRFENTKPYLPKDTSFVSITGGNHSYFGDYGFQRGDREADITREEQQQKIVENVVLFLEAL